MFRINSSFIPYNLICKPSNLLFYYYYTCREIWIFALYFLPATDIENALDFGIAGPFLSFSIYLFSTSTKLFPRFRAHVIILQPSVCSRTDYFQPKAARRSLPDSPFLRQLLRVSWSFSSENLIIISRRPASSRMLRRSFFFIFIFRLELSNLFYNYNDSSPGLLYDVIIDRTCVYMRKFFSGGSILYTLGRDRRKGQARAKFSLFFSLIRRAFPGVMILIIARNGKQIWLAKKKKKKCFSAFEKFYWFLYNSNSIS